MLTAETLVLIAVFAAIASLPAGMLAAHMLVHIATMNALAPLVALAALGVNRERHRRLYAPLAALLAPATLLQLALFIAMHAPFVFNSVIHAPEVWPLSTLALFAVSTLFWVSVIAAARTGRAGSIAAPLISGKVFCLLAALLVFAERAVFGPLVSIADQQAAGLVMLIACPITYVGASLVIVTKWLGAMSRPPSRMPT